MAENKYVVIHGKAADAEEAILMCGEALYNEGIVGAEFGKNCVIREKDFPTGLPTEIPVAIPHCQDDSVKVNAICVLMLEQPVEFRRMDDEEESIMADMLFNLAVMDADEHLEALQNLMAFLNNIDMVKECREKNDEELIECLKRHIG